MPAIQEGSGEESAKHWIRSDERLSRVQLPPRIGGSLVLSTIPEENTPSLRVAEHCE